MSYDNLDAIFYLKGTGFSRRKKLVLETYMFSLGDKKLN